MPYVPSDEVGLLPAEARDHEPLVALDGGDGLDVLRRVAAGAPEWLAPGGCVLVETSRHLSGPVEQPTRRSTSPTRPVGAAQQPVAFFRSTVKALTRPLAQAVRAAPGGHVWSMLGKRFRQRP